MSSTTVHPERIASTMPKSDSYFPPWEDYWTKKILVPPTEIQPLLPTPISPALPLPELSLDDDDSPDSATSPISPKCSCPPNDDCVVETLALLVGSATLLTATAQYHAARLKRSNSTTDDSTRKQTPPGKISKLEPTVQKLLLPLVSGKDFDVADILLKHWRSNSAMGAFADRDLCSRLRISLASMGIDLVDTFAPMQYDLHLLLALMDYDDPGLQGEIEALSKDESSPKVKLLVEANKQLIVFSVKDILLSAEELRQDLQAKVEDLACQVDLHEIGMLLGVSKIGGR